MRGDAVTLTQPPGIFHASPPRGGAFDAEAAAEALQREMLGPPARRRIGRCVPGRARVTPADGVTLRYALDLVDPSGGISETVVNAHLLPSAAARRRLLEGRLRPLAHRARGRPELRAFTQPIAAVDALGMVAAAYPIDADLPTLVEASDPRKAAALLGTGADLCAVSLVRYGRGSRCVLRYDTATRIVLGKVSDDDRGARAEHVLAALSSRRGRALPTRSFEVPRPIGYDPALRLLLLEWTPGVPRLSQLLRRYVRGEHSPMAEIEQAVETYGAIAAELHGSSIVAGFPRPIAADLARLAAEVAAVRRTAPELGRRLERTLAVADDRAARSRVLPARLCHGDLKHNQVLEDGARRTLVDFDTVCDAEPALDLGHFLGYLRLKVRDDAADGLCDRFVTAYLDAGGRTEAMRGLRERVAVYELLSLLGRAVHSYQKFKPERLAAIDTLLEERVACRVP